MPRTARLIYPGGIYHLISPLFKNEHLICEDEHRKYYLKSLGRCLRRTDTILLSWCIMPNGIHLVVKIGKSPLDALMRPLNTGFSAWLNNRLDGRRGPVFASRYRSVLVEENRFLLRLVRYVHNKPVVAGFARQALDSSWSSHKIYMGLETPPHWLNTRYILSLYSEKPENGRRAFGRFVDKVKNETNWVEFESGAVKATDLFRQQSQDSLKMGGPILGSEAFVGQVIKKLSHQKNLIPNINNINKSKPTLNELELIACQIMGVNPSQLREKPRLSKSTTIKKMLTWIWIRVWGGRQTEVSAHFGVSTAAVSKWYWKSLDQYQKLRPTITQILNGI